MYAKEHEKLKSRMDNLFVFFQPRFPLKVFPLGSGCLVAKCSLHSIFPFRLPFHFASLLCTSQSCLPLVGAHHCCRKAPASLHVASRIIDRYARGGLKDGGQRATGGQGSVECVTEIYSKASISSLNLRKSPSRFFARSNRMAGSISSYW